MEKIEFRLKGGIFTYAKEKAGITILSYQGEEAVVEVPDKIEDLPVVTIGKKAFLSKKRLKRVILPESVKNIEGWAFAHCSRLESITFSREVTLSKGVFLECGSLKEIHFSSACEEAVANCLPFLLAAVPVMLDADYLFMPKEAGTDSWLQKWDARMLTILRKEDEEGYTKVILCGEEDYGNNPEEFVREKRKEKARLAFLRLLHFYGLSSKTEQELREYLLAHTKGCESEEAWEILLSEHGNEAEYFQLFMDIGCVTEENFQDILTDMKEDCPEMKGMLLRYKEEKFGYEDFFGGLML